MRRCCTPFLLAPHAHASCNGCDTPVPLFLLRCPLFSKSLAPRYKPWDTRQSLTPCIPTRNITQEYRPPPRPGARYPCLPSSSAPLTACRSGPSSQLASRVEDYALPTSTLLRGM